MRPHPARPTRRHSLITLAALCTGLVLPGLGHGPDRRLAQQTGAHRRSLCPGGTTDILARVLAPELSKVFGQTFVVDNKAGAGGNIGAELVAKSPGDGYTILMGTVGTHGINKSLYSKLPYDPQKTLPPSPWWRVCPM